MGLFDRFKKENNNSKLNKDNTNIQANQEKFQVSYKVTKDGKIQVDFVDKHPDFRQLYDTTRLIVDPSPKEIGRTQFNDCLVSWYGQDDCVMFDEKGKEFSRRTNYSKVLTQLDLGALQTDPQYCKMVMNNLLKQKRVMEYLARGMEENPQTPCGEYIGGVSKRNGQYIKFFDSEAGKTSHYSKLMVDKRQKYREQKEIKRQKEIAAKKEQIARLQKEINDLYR